MFRRYQLQNLASDKVHLIADLFKSGRPIEDDLGGAPSPKPTPADKARYGKLASLYTAFSLDFASYALDLCLRAGCETIADPFGGMGTVAEAARTRPVKLQTSDISPFATLSAAFRSAPQASILDGIRYLGKTSKKLEVSNEREFYSKLFRTLEIDTKASVASIIANPSSLKHRDAAIVIYLAAASRIQLYKDLAGSNPTWMKRPDKAANNSSTLAAVASTLTTAQSFAQQLPPIHSKNRTKSVWSSIDDNSIAANSLDAIVTSPPYANRTDYIRHYLPASELLLEAAGKDERDVRTKQIGTPLIRETLPDAALPKPIGKVLKEIRTHSSYASERYYYKGFLYYFCDMHDALVRMRHWLRRGGLMLMVVQDSYYKDVHVPTTDLLLDLANEVGFKLTARRDWKVSQYLSQLSPHSRKLPNRSLSESVIILSK